MADKTKKVETYYEIYSQQFVDGKSKYCLSAQKGQIVAPKNGEDSPSNPMPLIDIADFNRDGMFDLLFLT